MSLPMAKATPEVKKIPPATAVHFVHASLARPTRRTTGTASRHTVTALLRSAAREAARAMAAMQLRQSGSAGSE
jgi:hypothetical protein